MKKCLMLTNRVSSIAILFVIMLFPGTISKSAFPAYQSEDSAIRVNPATASWRADGEAFLVSTEKRTTIYNNTFATLGSIDNTEQAAFSPDGKVIAAINPVDQTLYVYNAISFTEIIHFDHQLLSFVFSPDNHLIASIDSADRQSIYLYDRVELKLAQTVRLKSPTQIIRFSPNGQYLAINRTGMLDIWDTMTVQNAGQIPIEEAFGLQSLSWSPDGQQIAIVSGQNKIGVIQRDSKQIAHMLNINDPVTDIAKDERTYILAWNPEGYQLASASQVSTYSNYPNDNSIQIWNTKTGEIKLFLQAQHVTLLAWNPQGNVLAAGSYSYDPLNMNTTAYAAFRLWNPETGELLASNTRSGRIEALAWSPDGSRLLSVYDEGSIYLAEINTDGYIESGKTFEMESKQ